jgi:hypothetical protein
VGAAGLRPEDAVRGLRRLGHRVAFFQDTAAR